MRNFFCVLIVLILIVSCKEEVRTYEYPRHYTFEGRSEREYGVYVSGENNSYSEISVVNSFWPISNLEFRNQASRYIDTSFLYHEKYEYFGLLNEEEMSLRMSFDNGLELFDTIVNYRLVDDKFGIEPFRLLQEFGLFYDDYYDIIIDRIVAYKLYPGPNATSTFCYDYLFYNHFRFASIDEFLDWGFSLCDYAPLDTLGYSIHEVWYVRE